MQIGIKATPFNFVLRENRKLLGMTQKELAELANVQTEFIGQLELLKLPPGTYSSIRDKLNRVSQAIEIDFDILFPQEYLDAIQKKVLPKCTRTLIWIREVKLSELPPSVNEQLALPEPEDFIIEGEMKELLPKVLLEQLDTLSDKEAKVIKLRFGIDSIDYKEKTLEEVGKIFDVTSERIRCVEARALQKLRHLNRSEQLREYLS